MSLTIGVLFTVGVYLILSKSLLRIILGTSSLTHGVHLLLLTMSRLKTGSAPLLGEKAACLCRSAASGANFNLHRHQLWRDLLLLRIGL